ncbi:hypothetical protein ABH935_005895 [Catenulispora sp. GAS73]
MAKDDERCGPRLDGTRSAARAGSPGGSPGQSAPSEPRLTSSGSHRGASSGTSTGTSSGTSTWTSSGTSTWTSSGTSTWTNPGTSTWTSTGTSTWTNPGTSTGTSPAAPPVLRRARIPATARREVRSRLVPIRRAPTGIPATESVRPVLRRLRRDPADRRGVLGPATVRRFAAGQKLCNAREACDACINGEKVASRTAFGSGTRRPFPAGPGAECVHPGPEAQSVGGFTQTLLRSAARLRDLGRRYE